MIDFEYYAPTSLQEAISVLDEQRDGAKVLAGGTDLIVQMKDGVASPTTLVDLKNIPELNRLDWDKNGILHLGAAVSISKIIAFPPVIERFSILHQAFSLIGSVQIRNRATIGGNICNAAPSADSPPSLICLGARAILAKAGETRVVPIEELFRGPGQTLLAPSEILVELEIPAPPIDSAGCYLRHTPREEMDIAVVGVASFLIISVNDNRCQEARIVLGAVAPKPIRVPQAESILVENVLDSEAIEKAAEKAAEAASPISDIRGSAEYRRALVKLLTRRTLEKALLAHDIHT